MQKVIRIKKKIAGSDYAGKGKESIPNLFNTT
jgi:hypothetical protein